jgi:hypothetical protein
LFFLCLFDALLAFCLGDFAVDLRFYLGEFVV